MKISNSNKTNLRDYQQEVSTEVVNSYGSEKPFVLGACPNSGKTRTTIDIIINLIESGKAKRILVLTHGTNVIKQNFIDDCKEFLLEDAYSTDPTDNASIHIALPQNHNKIGNDYDVIVVDEAHQFYHAETVQALRNRINPSLTLLLTGTPSSFIANQDRYNIRIIAMNEIDSKYFHDVSFKLVKSDYAFGLENYNSNSEINAQTKILMKNTTKTINNIVYGMVEHIAKRDGIHLDKDFNAWDEAKTFFNTNKLGKTLFVCKRIGQARQVAKILNDNGITTYVSDSQNDSKSELIQSFKDGKIQVLCVVNRAKEGFSDSNMVNLIDLSMTHNINTICQTYCRVVRKCDWLDNKKLYIKVTPNVEGMTDYTMSIVSAALMLSHHRYLSTYNGRNFSGLVVPKINTTEEDNGQIALELPEYKDDVETAYLTEDNVWVDVNGNEVAVNDQGQPLNVDGEPMRISNDSIDVELEEDVEEKPKKYLDKELKNEIDSSFFIETAQQLSEGNIIYGTTTIGKARAALMGNDFMGVRETFDVCVANELVSKQKYVKFRKENPQLKINSNPWRVVDKKFKEYFDEVKKELGVSVDFLPPSQTFKVCVDNKLTNSIKYFKFREQNPYLNLLLEPWKKLGRSTKNYFNEIKGELGFNVLSNKEVFNICVNNKLTSSTKYVKFRKENPQLNLAYDPFKKANESELEYFSKIKVSLGMVEKNFMSIEETFNVCVNNNLIYESKYVKFRKENPQLSLYSAPYRKTTKSCGEYFLSVREAINSKVG